MFLLTMIVCDQWHETAKQDVLYSTDTHLVALHVLGAYKIKLQRIGTVYAYAW